MAGELPQPPEIVAARIVLVAALDLFQADPHNWSVRDCSTCAAISAIAGKLFGCLEYRRRREAGQNPPGGNRG